MDQYRNFISDEEPCTITIVQLTDSTVSIESNYDIVGCFEEDYIDGEIVNLQSLFEDNLEINIEDGKEPDNNACEEISGDVSLNSNNNEIQMDELLQELRSKFGLYSGEEECFPSNPLMNENLGYEDFLPLCSESRIGRVDWCTCENCVTMPTNLESICCKEVENATPYICSFQCITQHEFFSIFCQREDTVNVVLRIVGQLQRPPPKKQENRHHRKIAYRSFTAWVHGYLGIGNRRPIPSCVVNKVRTCFPDPDSEYTGFKECNDHPAEFMAFE
ncbi:uncharacterized protein LOC122923908 [Bufo gargarizans]|uniref:uncharacterized protein LOC122923908 n=1 Tax=Bufo gargarizans TaxID=30331 RepID=UPI001CF5EA9A|nr:uncharacterized protein LOC122923908 [Bufo gargarizans]